MPLANKYIKYSPEITLKMFTLIWNKLISSGWKEYSNKIIEVSYSQFKTQYNHLTHQQDKTFNTDVCPYEKEYTETTVQEILGYDPFVKEVIKEVIPEYVECINSAGTVILKVGMIYRVLSKGVCSCGTSWYLLEDVNLEKCCTCGNSAPSSAYNLNRFKPSTKEAYDAQNQPKQPLKQAVHCKTQEEWDFTCGKLKRKSFCKFNELGDCIKVDNPGVSFFIRKPDKDYQILSFQEWCDLNGYKMKNEIKSNQEFKIGDWVIIEISGYGANSMDIGLLCKVSRTNINGFLAGYSIEIDRHKHGNNGDRTLNPLCLRHATPEEINNHLISIGQIPMGIQSSSTSDNTYNHLISYGNKIHEEFFNPTVKFERTYGYTVNPKYKQEFNIINKTKTIKF